MTGRASMFDTEVNQFAAFLTAHPCQPGGYPRAVAEEHARLSVCALQLATAVGLLATRDAGWHGTPTQRLARINELCAQFDTAHTRIRALFTAWLATPGKETTT